VLSLERPIGDEIAEVWTALFDGLPMIEDGIPEALVRAQASGALPARSAVYVESIEDAGQRGATRRSSLTTA
jgi:hypothetical protein